MLSNAAIAALLAMIALGVGYVSRSPNVRHAAWLIVLLKLVTPPVFSVPLSVLPASWGAPLAEPHTGLVVLTALSTSDRNRSTDGAVARPTAWWGWDWLSGASNLAIITWVLGAVAWFVWQGRRIIQFRRRVASAEDAPPEVEAAVTRLAMKLGIAFPPQVKIVTGIGSPVLWGQGRGAVVLFPHELLARLSAETRDTLLAHELAHFLRWDHWVRVLEFVVTGLYWWHPAVWLARRGIEAAEEECCDAWVVGGLAASPRLYAEALLATVNFEAELRRPRLPPGVCAANRSARLLHRRLVGIIHATPPRPLRGRIVMWPLVAVALLTRPDLRATTTEGPEPTPAHAEFAKAPVSSHSKPLRPPRKANEPRAWAVAEAPGGALTVLARDHEVVLRQQDGSTRVLGPGRPLALSFAPDGQRLATAGPGPLLRTWDDQGNLLAEARAPAAARAIAYMPDGKRLLVLDAAGRVSVRDSKTLALLSSWSVEGQANSIACAPDGLTVAVSFGSWLADTGRVECWSIADQKKFASYSASFPVGATRFGPDGRMLVIGGWNGLVTWRALPGGELIAERQLPKELVANTAFCPDAGTLPLAPPDPVIPQPGLEWAQRAAQFP